jgi:hypothetical protein
VKGVERVGEENRKRERRDSRSVVMGVRATESREEKEKGGENKRDEIFYGRGFMAFGVANKIFIHF